VFLGSAPNFQGTTEEYFMLTEVASASVTASSPGTPITPIALSVAAAMDEAYEGVLVTLTGVTKVDSPYSCAADNPACMDMALFELNDSIVGWDRFYGGGAASWTAEVAAAAADMTPSVTGVMHYRFDRRRIVPRAAGDITP
jgi:hypothetical protein